MVDFFDIVVEDGIFRARAFDYEVKQWYDVVANWDGSYHNCDNGTVIRATWAVIGEAKLHHRGKFPKKKTICWG